MASSEPRKGEHAEAPADQAADVPADGDVREDEAERGVDHDQPERAAAEDVVPLPLKDERTAENPEDRARGSDSRGGRRDDERAGGSGEAGDEVEEEEARAAEGLLDRRPDQVEEVHVQAEVQRPVVQERGAEQPP